MVVAPKASECQPSPSPEALPPNHPAIKGLTPALMGAPRLCSRARLLSFLISSWVNSEYHPRTQGASYLAEPPQF